MPKRCCYCGGDRGSFSREHPIPQSLYNADLHSGINRLTLPCHPGCNNQHSDDEADFKNVMILASRANPAAMLAWKSSLRSFDKCDGKHRFLTISEVLRPDRVEPTRTRVYPEESNPCKRIVTKAIRGLHFYHYQHAISAEQVEVDLSIYALPDVFLSQMNSDHRGPDVVRWWWGDFHFAGYTSVWAIQFFENCTFVALVKC